MVEIFIVGRKKNDMYFDIKASGLNVQTVRCGKNIRIERNTLIIGSRIPSNITMDRILSIINGLSNELSDDCHDDSYNDDNRRIRERDKYSITYIIDGKSYDILDLISTSSSSSSSSFDEDEDECECAPLQRTPRNIDDTGISSILMIIAVVAIVLIVAWALLYIGPRG